MQQTFLYKNFLEIHCYSKKYFCSTSFSLLSNSLLSKKCQIHIKNNTQELAIIMSFTDVLSSYLNKYCESKKPYPYFNGAAANLAW